jgi:hypothetical protein
MQISLSDEEANLLTAVCSQYLSDLREEIYKTETFEVKNQLKREEAVLKGILTRLGGE